MKTEWKILLFAIMFFTMLLSCDELESNKNDSDDSIAVHRDEWEVLKITNYSIYQTVRSWYPWYGDTVRIVVYADKIQMVQHASDFSAVDSSEWSRYRTIDDLFQLAELDTNIFDVEIEFDPTYSYQKYLHYSPKPPLNTEGGFAYFTWNFEPTPILIGKSAGKNVIR
ncbi:MAG: DUF6174 domain-containing protein [Candidatus Neomarinimicrobiota bacterium]